MNGMMTVQIYGDRYSPIALFVILTEQAQNFTFQHYNANLHLAASDTLCLILQQIPILPWLSRSPNLSPIECVVMFLDNACETLILPLASLRILTLNIPEKNIALFTMGSVWTPNLFNLHYHMKTFRKSYIVFTSELL